MDKEYKRKKTTTLSQKKASCQNRHDINLFLDLVDKGISRKRKEEKRRKEKEKCRAFLLRNPTPCAERRSSMDSDLVESRTQVPVKEAAISRLEDQERRKG